MDLEGSGHGLNEVLSLLFAWRYLGNPRKTSVRIAGVSAEVGTEHLPNTSVRVLKHYL
jgi:hypothetical protein